MTGNDPKTRLLLAKVDDFTRCYLTAALWKSDAAISETIDLGSYVDSQRARALLERLHPVCVAQAITDCATFQAANKAHLDTSGEYDQAGADFALRRLGGMTLDTREDDPAYHALERAAYAYRRITVTIPEDGGAITID